MIRAVEEHDMNLAPFIEFMLDKILRTLKAKGEAYEVGQESRVESRDKSRDKVLCLLRQQPDLTQAELANALELPSEMPLKTVGLIICREKDRVTVQYALESSSLPIGVSDYVLERFIPADFKSQMPTIEEVEGELTRRMEMAEARKLGQAD